eukprot:jgi/Mesen1/3726/ME000202S02814
MPPQGGIPGEPVHQPLPHGSCGGHCVPHRHQGPVRTEAPHGGGAQCEQAHRGEAHPDVPRARRLGPRARPRRHAGGRAAAARERALHQGIQDLPRRPQPGAAPLRRSWPELSHARVRTCMHTHERACMGAHMRACACTCRNTHGALTRWKRTARMLARSVRKRVLCIMQATFINDATTEEHARAWGHVHLSEVARLADRFKNEAILLIHFSARYKRQDILKAIDGLPAGLKERVTPLLERF